MKFGWGSLKPSIASLGPFTRVEVGAGPNEFRPNGFGVEAVFTDARVLHISGSWGIAPHRLNISNGAEEVVRNELLQLLPPHRRVGDSWVWGGLHRHKFDLDIKSCLGWAD